MEEVKKRGGRRENAGRKVSEGGRRTSRDVSLDNDTVSILKEYGEGNLSEGIRRAAVLVSLNQLIS